MTVLRLLALLACLALAFLPPVAEAQQARRWTLVRTTEPMDGARVVRAWLPASGSIRDSLGRPATPQLNVRCKRVPSRLGAVQVYVAFPNRLFVSIGDNIVRARLDDGTTYEDNWEASDTGRSLFWGRTEIVFPMRAASALHVEFAPPLSSRQYARFDLSDADSAIAQVVSACTLSGPELDEYNRWATEQLRLLWLEEMQQPYNTAYSNALAGLRRVSIVPPWHPGESVDARPVPVGDLVLELMSYMERESLCIYRDKPDVCPLSLRRRQASVYFNIGAEQEIQENLQWSEAVQR